MPYKGTNMLNNNIVRAQNLRYRVPDHKLQLHIHLITSPKGDNIDTCGLDRKYRVLVSVVCLSVCLSVSMITQKINGL